MRYQDLTTVLSNAAAAVIGTGTYTHAGRLDYSLSSGYEPFPHLNTFLPSDSTPDVSKSVRSFRVLFVALDQEPAGASPEQKSEILAKMDGLVQGFIAALDGNDEIQISGIRREPQPRSYAGGVSGYAAECLVTGYFNNC